MMGDNPLKKANDAEKAEQTVKASAPESKPVESLTMQEKLDLLDKRIAEDEGINVANIDSVRSYVQSIMVTLKEEPELDAILIDRDVHNILAFVQADRNRAIEAIEEKKVKREKKATNKKKRGASMEGVDLSDLGFGGLEDIANSET